MLTPIYIELEEQVELVAVELVLCFTNQISKVSCVQWKEEL